MESAPKSCGDLGRLHVSAKQPELLRRLEQQAAELALKTDPICAVHFVEWPACGSQIAGDHREAVVLCVSTENWDKAREEIESGHAHDLLNVEDRRSTALREACLRAVAAYERNAQVARLESERKSRFESSPVPTLRLSIESSEVTAANAPMLELLGYSCEAEVIGLCPAKSFVTDPGYVPSRIIEYQTNGMLGPRQMEIRRADGELRLVTDWSMPVRRARGKTALLESCFIDVSEEVRLAEALANEKDRLLHIAEGAAECIWELDRDTGIYTFVVNRLTGTLGYTDDGAGKTVDWWMRLMHPDDVAAIKSQVAARRDGESRRQSDFRMLCKDGTYRWFRTYAQSADDGSGSRIYGFTQDIDELKTKELEISRLNTELLAAHRAAGMAEVATGVLHNVGNALNSINISAQSILDSIKSTPTDRLKAASSMLLPDAIAAQPDRAAKAATYVRETIGRLNDRQQTWVAESQSIVTGVNHVSQSIARQQSYAGNLGGVSETIELDTIVADAISLHLASHPVVTTRHSLTKIPAFTADKHRLMQIVVNLLRNAKHAAEASDSDVPQVNVELTHDGGQARLVVADNGIGIGEEAQARLFEYGFTTKPHGHGFGLHSSALAVQEMGGELTFSSDGLGKGAEFTLTIPLKDDSIRPGELQHKQTAEAALS